MKKRNLISFGAALILLFGDCFCINRDKASSSNRRYSAEENSQAVDTEQIIKCPLCGRTKLWKNGTRGEKQKYKCKNCGKNLFFIRDSNGDIDQKRSKAIRDSHNKKADACRYLNDILPENEYIYEKKQLNMDMCVAYYKFLGGTYNEDKKYKFQYKTYSEVADYFGVTVRTLGTALRKLTSAEFYKIEPEDIKDLADEIVENYKSHPDKDSSNSPLIGAIIALKDLGFSCIRIIELLGLDFNSNRENQNMGSVNEASSSNPRYSVDNRNPRMRIEYLLSESVPENQNIVPVDDSNREHPSASEQSLVNNNSTERISNDGSADNKTSYLGKRRKISDSEGRKKSKGKQPDNESDDLIEILSDTESDESDGLIEILSDTESENESFENKRKRARF